DKRSRKQSSQTINLALNAVKFLYAEVLKNLIYFFLHTLFLSIKRPGANIAVRIGLGNGEGVHSRRD
ncbi:MAG: hypothetical protein COU08_02990, partial [Candidatus Harrisonbacteria bacterium CG10_big_fil_rev_8_21_14_0_10_42_17]